MEQNEQTPEKAPAMDTRTRAVLDALAKVTRHPLAHIRALYKHIESIDDTIKLCELARTSGRGLDEILKLIQQGYAIHDTGAKPIDIVFKVAENGNISLEFSDKIQFLVLSDVGAMELAKNLIDTAATARMDKATQAPKIIMP